MKNMIYNIHGFQHDKLMELGLDNDDALILRAIKNMYSSATIEYKIIDGDKFVWVKQDFLVQQVQLIGSKRKIVRRMEVMQEKNIIDTRTVYSRKGRKGTYYYVRLTPTADYLTKRTNDKTSDGEDDQATECHLNGMTERHLNGMTKRHSKDTQETRDSQERRDTTTTIGGEEELKRIDTALIMKEWNKLDDPIPKIVTLNSGTKRYKSLKSRIEEFGEENVLRAIENITRSDFLKGNNNNKWTIDFDWFIRPNNFIKVLEGNYENKDKVTSNSLNDMLDPEMVEWFMNEEF